MSERGKEENCIRCATCVHACPMGLEPYLLIAQARNQRWEDMKTHLAMNCIECGSCAYVCPSHKPLLDFIKLGKQEIRKLK
jgi:electron transport complex protein RnfC